VAKRFSNNLIINPPLLSPPSGSYRKRGIPPLNPPLRLLSEGEIEGHVAFKNGLWCNILKIFSPFKGKIDFFFCMNFGRGDKDVK